MCVCVCLFVHEREKERERERERERVKEKSLRKVLDMIENCYKIFKPVFNLATDI